MKSFFALLLFAVAAHCQNVPAAPESPAASCNLPDAPQPANPNVIVVRVPVSNPAAWQRLEDEAAAVKLLQQDAKDWRIVDLERRKKLRKLFNRINAEW